MNEDEIEMKKLTAEEFVECIRDLMKEDVTPEKKIESLKLELKKFEKQEE